MRFFVNCLLVSALLLSGVMSSHAGKRHHAPKFHKIGKGSISFGVVIGVTAPRHPKHVYRIVRQKQFVKSVAQGCSARQASDLAREFGIRYQTIYRTSRTMTVVGYRNGRPAKLRISRKPHCDIFN